MNKWKRKKAMYGNGFWQDDATYSKLVLQEELQN